MLTLNMRKPIDKDRTPKYWSERLENFASSRNEAQFAELHAHFAPLIRSFLQSKGGDNAYDAAEELAQEVMMKVWLKADSFDSSKAAASTWIFTLARNARVDYIRKHARHNENTETLTTEDIFEDDDPNQPFTYLHQNRAETQVKHMLSEIPKEQSQCLRKMYMEGKSHSEISNELSLPLGTVKSRVRLALKRLQANWGHIEAN